jgi:hypothetical protein
VLFHKVLAQPRATERYSTTYSDATRQQA